MNYAELNRLPAIAFCNPESFRTVNDVYPLIAEKQYREGLRIGSESAECGVSAFGTWYAVGKDGSVTTSYEGIGYNSHTADLLRGFLDSGCAVCVFRHENGGFTGYKYRICHNDHTRWVERVQDNV